MQRVLERIVMLTICCLLLGFAGAPRAARGAGEIDLTIDGVPFPAGRSEVTNERAIEVAGTPIVLATWDERAASGELSHAFGVSLDGQALVRVASTNYELGLRYAHFDPLAGVPEVAAELAAAPDNRLYLVQCVTQPLEVFNQQITERGGIVRHYVAQFAYLVEADPAAIDAIAALPYVRWIGPYQPAYRLEEFMVQNLDRAQELYPSQAYDVQVLSVDEKAVVADRIRSIGGTVQKADAGKVLLEAVLTPEQLFAVAGWNEVLFIDRWGPYETDMDIAREIGGADFIETVAGYSGQGVRGEVFDVGFNLNHVDFASRPLIEHGGAVGSATHGASTSGINFGDGTGSANARGLLPDGQGIVADVDNIGLSGPSRYASSGELVQPPYNAVFQTSSVGSPRTTQYSTISADTDAILFDFDISFCQSQSNAGDQMSRPQAWAKNIISGGAVYHYNTLDKGDDCWCNGASIGPASDGRIKPTLASFYDWIRTTTCCGATAYTNTFGGTSGATPIICGHVGLFYQMWGDGIFGNTVLPGGTVFGNRSHMTTAKAMLVNTADQYDFVGPFDDKTRVHQGWGMPDVKNLYELRDEIFVIDESKVLAPFEVVQYPVVVGPGEPAFKVTMTYADPPGNPAVQTQHRINDLDLRVTAPNGDQYYGNLGLLDTPWSLLAPVPDDKNTVENVFIQNPEAGTWLIEVEAVELIQDSHVETAALDADFALVASPVQRQTAAVDAGEPLPEQRLQLAILSIGPGVRAARVSFELAAAAPVRLRLFDVSGRQVATLYEGNLPAGPHTLEWPGADDAGNPVGAGVYFARLEAGGRTVTGKVLVMR